MQLGFESISYRYKWFARDVIRSLTWQLPPGRTVLLGPNGSGKTTLLGLGANALTPRSGRVLIDGREVRTARDRDDLRRSVGWMPQHSRAVPGLSVIEQIQLSSWLKGVSSKQTQAQAEGLCEAVDLTAYSSQSAGSLSGGQLRRLGLAQALAGSPRFLLLDEPTVGLDPAQRASFRELIAHVPAEVPLLASTHQTDDLALIFQNVVVFMNGTVVFEGSVSKFLSLGSGVDESHRAESAYLNLTRGATTI